MAALSALAMIVGVAVVAVTVLPVFRSHEWWIRIWDYPRLQIAVIAGADVLFLALVQDGFTALAWGLTVALVLSIAWQLSYVWRFLPIAPVEVAESDLDVASTNCLTLMTTNVKQEARDAQALGIIIRDADPDLVLAVEADEWWCARLVEAVGSRFPHQLLYPLSTGYGLAVFSRLELVEPSIRFILDEAIPSIKTGVRMRSGALIELYGVHPQPPRLFQDSTERDLELIAVGREIARTAGPSVVMGDLNDVAWSPTSLRFKQLAKLLDPRRGRGLFNTFPAGMPGLRYPLDHIFHTAHFDVRDLKVLPRFKSDHLPLKVTLCLRETPQGSAAQETRTALSS